MLIRVKVTKQSRLVEFIRHKTEWHRYAIRRADGTPASTLTQVSSRPFTPPLNTATTGEYSIQVQETLHSSTMLADVWCRRPLV